MKGINRNRFWRFFSRMLLTAMLLIMLAGLQQSCSVNLTSTSGGGNVGDIESNSGAGDSKVEFTKFEDAGAPKDLSLEVGGLIDQFRDKMLTWDSSTRTMSDSLRGELIKIVDGAYSKAQRLNKLDPQRARATFYLSYWTDFQERVLDGMSQCRKASSLYREALELYRKVYEKEDNASNISDENAFIIIELAHWVINRDAGPKHYGGFDGYTEALSLLKLISSNPSLSNEIRYNVLVSQGVAQFGQKKLYSRAADYFEDALEIYPQSSDVTYNLGSMKAYEGNYKQAIELYKSAIQKNNFARTTSEETVKLTPDIVRRDIGFAHILQEMFEEPSTQLDNYASAVTEFDEVIRSTVAESDLKAYAHIGKSLSLYQMDNVDGAITELQEGGNSEFARYVAKMIERGENNNPAIIDLIKTVSFGNVVPHDQEEDPVLDIHHKLFYCAGGDERISGDEQIS